MHNTYIADHVSGSRLLLTKDLYMKAIVEKFKNLFSWVIDNTVLIVNLPGEKPNSSALNPMVLVVFQS